MRNVEYVPLLVLPWIDRRKESFPTVFSSALTKIAGYCWEKKYINTMFLLKHV